MKAPKRAERGATEESDTDLLRRMAEADPDALGALYDRYGQDVYRLARRVSPWEDAEEIVQLTFLRSYAIAQSYDGRSLSARGWVFGVATQILRERRRSFRRLKDALGRYRESMLGRHPNAVDPTLRPDVDRALASLSDSMRSVLVLSEGHGFTCEEIARMLDVPVGTVWNRLHHAKKKLRERFEEAP